MGLPKHFARVRLKIWVTTGTTVCLFACFTFSDHNKKKIEGIIRNTNENYKLFHRSSSGSPVLRLQRSDSNHSNLISKLIVYLSLVYLSSEHYQDKDGARKKLSKILLTFSVTDVNIFRFIYIMR